MTLFSDLEIKKQLSSDHLNMNLDMFTESQIDFIKSELRDFLYFFNYSEHPLDSDPNTSFYSYESGSVKHD